MTIFQKCVSKSFYFFPVHLIAKSARLPLIVGAGIKSAEDVRISINMGGAGIAVASDVVKANNPEKELLDLIKGFEG